MTPAGVRRARRMWISVGGAAVLVVGLGFSGLARPLGVPDTALHVIAWAVLGGLVSAALARSHADAHPAARGVAAVALVVAFGALDELAQTWAPLRSSQWGDLFADAVGGTLGASLHAAALLHLRRPRAADASELE